jgi:hypothetical protein
MLRSKSVFRLLAVLTHHDNWRLDRGKAGKDEVKKNKRVRINRALQEYERVYPDPESKEGAETDKKHPAAAK